VNKDKVIQRWTVNQANDNTFSRTIYWLTIPEVQKRYQQKATKCKYNNWAEYCLKEFLGDRLPVEKMLSVGCGTGGLERNLANRGAFVSCDAFDITPASIEKAKSQAQIMGISNIFYQVVDVETIDLPVSYYDAVWFNGSLHHIEKLEYVCIAVAKSLKPNGYLFFNEYIGPSRFDFTDRQKEVMQSAFALIPKEYRRCFIPGYPYEFKQEVSIPNPKKVQETDPSEATRSAEILTIVNKHFHVIAKNDLGGTILHFLLSGIAGNFRSDNPESIAVLNMLFNIEDTLLELGDINSDFAVVVAQPKS